MRGGWRGEKRNGRSAGGRPQSGDKPYVAASSRCPRGRSRGRGVVSIVARTFGLLLLPSLCPLPLPPPSRRLSISTCASVSGRASSRSVQDLAAQQTQREEMRERDRESPAGTRVTRLVAFVSHGSNRLSSLSRSSRERLE